MIDIFIGFLPDKLVLTCTVIAFIVPYAVYKVNQKLHEAGDPVWKEEEQKP